MRGARSLILALSLLGGPSSAGAQDLPPVSARTQLRADVISARDRTAIQAGAGVQLPAGIYARIDLLGAVGLDVSHRSSQHTGSSAGGRVDVIGRFLLDPFQQMRWGLSVGGGLSVLAARGDRLRPVLAVAADLERRRTSPGIAPAFQLGLGGGVRAGMALRWGTVRTR